MATANQVTLTKLPLGGEKFVDVTPLFSTPRVHVREFYEAGGDLLPGKKGLALNPEQWTALKEAIAWIDHDATAIQYGCTTKPEMHFLGNNRYVQATYWQNTCLIQLREAGEDKGKFYPTKKAQNKENMFQENRQQHPNQ